ncbi:MAG: DEAD/DEAH box helicase [Janthinobacterium lividum]
MKPQDSLKLLTSQDALNVLSAWTALEVLSPTSFNKPEELNNNDVKSVIYFDNSNNIDLPWLHGTEVILEDKKIFYQIILETLDVKKCMEALIDKYGDEGVEFPLTSGQAVVGSVTVDEFGYPVTDKPATSLSSFAWGVPQALNGNLKDLAEWPSKQNEILCGLNQIFFPRDGTLPIQVSMETLDHARFYLSHALDIPDDLLSGLRFALRIYQEIKKNKNNEDEKKAESPWPLLINSFYLNDLAQAKDLIFEGKASKNLLRYLGVEVPDIRHSVLGNHDLLKDALAPKNMPIARWPGKGRHPLVLKQQAAVNLSLLELKNDGIFGINGPPGTGKTTLLRDIVAGIVTKRAEAMLQFDDPEKAFKNPNPSEHSECSKYLEHSEYPEYRVDLDSWSFRLYEIDDALKGFEILIASSNNKAVENISAELPGIDAIADDADELRYFETLSDHLLSDHLSKGKTWGLISAILGNSSNRSQFCEKFWWNDDFCIRSYLREVIEYQSVQFAEKHPKTHEILRYRTPQIIQDCNPPLNHMEALKQWNEARDRFIEASEKVQKKLDDLQEKKDCIYEIQSYEETLKNNQDLSVLMIEHQKSEPYFISKILRFPSARLWQKETERLAHWQKLKEKTEPYFKRLSSHLVDSNLFSNTPQEYNQISPWCDKELKILRDEVFIEAIKLHKAFIGAAAKPLKENLAIFMKYLRKPSEFMDKKLLDLMPNVWSSFFLTVPTVSTTFAATNAMLKGLPNEGLGWLLIDEAGQALPQAAVGALMKTKRAIVTGDPLQIEPVITLPPKLTKAIFQQFEADASKFNPPKASVQTLADEASRYYAEIETEGKSRFIGFPLWVHRRCTSPMFEISNKIAYENLMVQANKSKTSAIRDCLGPSAWFDIADGSNNLDKWCPAEGEKVVDLLRQLKDIDIFPDLYIITPFKFVAHQLREEVMHSDVLQSWHEIKPEYWVRDNIGTVHTFQGREAEAVIMVLGSPLLEQSGSKKWAGATPNLLNVAVTRAKEVLYIVGNRSLWKNVGVFKELDMQLSFAETESRKFAACG